MPTLLYKKKRVTVRPQTFRPSTIPNLLFNFIFKKRFLKSHRLLPTNSLKWNVIQQMSNLLCFGKLVPKMIKNHLPNIFHQFHQTSQRKNWTNMITFSSLFLHFVKKSLFKSPPKPTHSKFYKSIFSLTSNSSKIYLTLPF